MLISVPFPPLTNQIQQWVGRLIKFLSSDGRRNGRRNASLTRLSKDVIPRSTAAENAKT